MEDLFCVSGRFLMLKNVHTGIHCVPLNYASDLTTFKIESKGLFVPNIVV